MVWSTPTQKQINNAKYSTEMKSEFQSLILSLKLRCLFIYLKYENIYNCSQLKIKVVTGNQFLIKDTFFKHPSVFKFQDTVMSGTNSTPISEACTATMVMLIRDYKYGYEVIYNSHYVCSKLHKNWILGTKIIGKGRFRQVDTIYLPFFRCGK
jgi:hypothetical protein